MYKAELTGWHQYENPHSDSLVRMVVIWLCDSKRGEGLTVAGYASEYSPS
jgi:hypothetical protein